MVCSTPSGTTFRNFLRQRRSSNHVPIISSCLSAVTTERLCFPVDKQSEGPAHYSRRQKKKRPNSKTKITARLRKWTTPKLTASTRMRQGEDTLNMIALRIVNGARRKSIGKKLDR